MRRSKFILTILTVLFSACSKGPELSVQDNGTNEKGAVSISLTAKDDHQIVIPVKSTVGEVPPVDSFKIEIFDPQGVRIYRDKYVNTPSSIWLNAGEHRLLASHGNPLGVGFNSIYFAADTTFVIQGQDTVSVEAEAKMANVKVSVNFGENLKVGYPDYYAKVKCPSKTKKYLQFAKTEIRSGYIPDGDLVFELYALIGGVWKYYPATPLKCNPNDHITFNVDTDPREFEMNLNVRIDNTLEVIDKSFSIPAEALPQNAPEFSVSGSFEGTAFKFIQGMDYPDTKIDIFAPSGIKNCFVEVTSDYFTSLGLPAKLDLAQKGAQGQDILSNVGIAWVKGMAGCRFSFIDFSAMSHKLTFDAEKPFQAQFKVTVVDNNDKQTVSEIYDIVHLPPELNFAPQAYNMFARKAEGLAVEVVSGNPSLVGLQWSQDQKIWNDATVKEISGKTVNINTITGLSPDTSYYFRTIYNNDENITSAPVSLTTEADSQVANSGFEEWADETFNFIWVLASKSIEWYRPWNAGGEASAWWDTNSRATLHDRSSLLGNQNTRFFPCAAYTVNNPYAGAKSAMVYVTYVTSTEYMDQTTPGEIFLGKAGSSGEHTAEGHEFTSRPQALKFAYRYDSYNNETFYVKMDVRDESGAVIGTVEKSDLGASQSWTTAELPVVYSDITKKAHSIYIIFKSSSSAKPGTREIPMNIGNNKSYSTGCHIGSILYLDSVEMVY